MSNQRQTPRPRLHRFNLENQIYHVSTATAGRAPVFADAASARVLLESIQFLRNERAYILAFAIMPDHLHLLLVPKPGQDLPATMQTLKGFSSRRINQNRGGHRNLWQRSYYDRMIRTEEQLRVVIDYIEQNPLKAGLCDDPNLYPYSSAGKPELTDLLEYLSG